MNRRRLLFPVAELVAFAGIVAGGYLVIASSGATALPPAANERPVEQAAQQPGERPPAASVARAMPATLPTARLPVPLLVSHRTPFEDPAPADAAVPEQKDTTADSGAAAKAMIEADGYKGVKSLVRTADGLWRGIALRGNVEVAVSVDANGSVSTQ